LSGIFVANGKSKKQKTKKSVKHIRIERLRKLASALLKIHTSVIMDQIGKLLVCLRVGIKTNHSECQFVKYSNCTRLPYNIDYHKIT